MRLRRGQWDFTRVHSHELPGWQLETSLSSLRSADTGRKPQQVSEYCLPVLSSDSATSAGSRQQQYSLWLWAMIVAKLHGLGWPVQLLNQDHCMPCARRGASRV